MSTPSISSSPKKPPASSNRSGSSTSCQLSSSMLRIRASSSALAPFVGFSTFCRFFDSPAGPRGSRPRFAPILDIIKKNRFEYRPCWPCWVSVELRRKLCFFFFGRKKSCCFLRLPSDLIGLFPHICTLQKLARPPHDHHEVIERGKTKIRSILLIPGLAS
jgi:hypothetical protein